MDRKKHPKERCPVLYKQNSSERVPQWIQNHSENLFAISNEITPNDLHDDLIQQQTNAQNLYILKLHLNLFEISNQFENLKIELKYEGLIPSEN